MQQEMELLGLQILVVVGGVGLVVQLEIHLVMVVQE